jgi:tetratricopeptide (TPR) repeat protein
LSPWGAVSKRQNSARPPYGPPFGGPPPGPPGAHQAPPGPDRPQGGDDSHLSQAIQLLNELNRDQSNNPEYRYLLALCYRERAGRAHSSDSIAAIQLLEELSQQHPAVADYRYELSKTYARTDVRGLRDDELDGAEERLRTALRYADALAVEHASIPEYAQSRAHTNHKLGTVVHRSARHFEGPLRDNRFQESEELYAEAVRIQSALVEHFSEAIPYKLWLATMQQSLANALSRADKFEEARSIVEMSITSLKEIPESSRDAWFVHRFLFEHHRTLAIILDQLGDPAGASQACEEADRHRRQGPRRPERPPRRRP